MLKGDSLICIVWRYLLFLENRENLRGCDLMSDIAIKAESLGKKVISNSYYFIGKNDD
jgi:hypothetical protein